MYSTDDHAAELPQTLADRLRNDPRGELRDTLARELQDAEDQVLASLAERPGPDEAGRLQALLAAVHLGQREVAAAWSACHERRPAGGLR